MEIKVMSEAFERLPKESAKAFAAFSEYLNLGPERSLAGVVRKLAKSEQLLKRWSAKYDWTNRVQAHAAHLAIVEREATEALARGKSAEWLTRQTAVREREWRLHEKCIAAVEKALDVFLAKETVHVNLADIARMLEVASKMGRLATGMPTERTEVTGENGGPIQVEFEVALRKIYGEVLTDGDLADGHLADGSVVDVEVKPLGEEKQVAGVGVSTN